MSRRGHRNAQRRFLPTVRQRDSSGLAAAVSAYPRMVFASVPECDVGCDAGSHQTIALFLALRRRPSEACVRVRWRACSSSLSTGIGKAAAMVDSSVARQGR